jgi:hypothetical protein
VAKKKVKLPLTGFAMKGPLFGIVQNPSKVELKKTIAIKA